MVLYRIYKIIFILIEGKSFVNFLFPRTFPKKQRVISGKYRIVPRTGYFISENGKVPGIDSRAQIGLDFCRR
jgi:hypothetical protein